jgi:hypothetical protein
MTMMEAVRTSETLVNYNVTTRRYIPEYSELHTRRRQNLKFHSVILRFYLYSYAVSPRLKNFSLRNFARMNSYNEAHTFRLSRHSNANTSIRNVPNTLNEKSKDATSPSKSVIAGKVGPRESFALPYALVCFLRMVFCVFVAYVIICFRCLYVSSREIKLLIYNIF